MRRSCGGMWFTDLVHRSMSRQSEPPMHFMQVQNNTCLEHFSPFYTLCSVAMAARNSHPPSLPLKQDMLTSKSPPQRNTSLATPGGPITRRSQTSSSPNVVPGTNSLAWSPPVTMLVSVSLSTPFGITWLVRTQALALLVLVSTLQCLHASRRLI